MDKNEGNEREQGKGVVGRLERLVGCVDPWPETTKRNGAVKICRDTFISETPDNCTLALVMNGRIKGRVPISQEDKARMVRAYGLVGLRSVAFRSCKTWRTTWSHGIVSDLLRQSTLLYGSQRTEGPR